MLIFLCQTRFTTELEMEHKSMNNSIDDIKVFDTSKKFNVIELNELYLSIFKFGD